jgi:diguanylate cyclase (GGDEF)-like protein/PAS domain S-box-containing protein
MSLDSRSSVEEDVQRAMKWGRYAWVLAAAWTVVVAGGLVLDLVERHRTTRQLAILEGRAYLDKDQALRYWATSHGGVYVPVDARSQPNPYLAHLPERDIETPSGKPLTLMNHTYILRQMREYFGDSYGAIARITSLMPLRPEDAPDEWERAALQSFERGNREAFEFTRIGAEPYLRMMQPLHVEAGCLKCHGLQGYRLGDLRGGAGIALPLTPFLDRERNGAVMHVLSFALLWVFGLAGMGWASRRLIRQEEERKQARETLRRQQALNARILDQLPLNIFLKDRHGRLASVNESVTRILQLPREEVIGKTDFDLFPPELAALMERDDARALTCGGVIQREERVVVNGQELHLLVARTRIDGEGTDGPFLLGFSLDITERKLAEQALARREEHFRSLIENALDLITVIQPDGCVRYASPSAERVLGYEPDELLGRNLFELIHPDDLPSVRNALAEVLAHAGATRSAEYRFRHRDGRWRVLESIGKTFPEDAGTAAVVLNSRDVTERKQVQQALQDSQAFIEQVINTDPNLIFVTDKGGNVTLVNQALANILGIMPGDLIDQTNALVRAPGDAASESATMDEEVIATMREVVFDGPFTRPDGEIRWYHTIRKPLVRADGSVHVLTISSDITERKHAEAQLLHDAFHDGLTGLPNRDLFMDRLRHAIERGKRHKEYLFAVVFLDLDRFKTINDSLGHLAGDQLLIGLAQRLQGCLRPSDAVARLGGDEFAILLDHITDVSDATRVAERIQQEFALPFDLDGHEVFTSASMGIALSVSVYDQPEHVLRDADTAMYRAKALGKARYQLFDTAMHARAVAQLQLETDLRRAVERREFELHYQPIIALPTGALTGFEALVRWRHPTQGTVPTAQLIALAEETGMILSIGRWVMEQACRQLQLWRRKFPAHSGLTMSVNLSVKQFAHPELLEQIGQALRENGLDGKSLRLEITESVLLELSESVQGILARLRALGIQICMDDFGTGYSSLSNLHRFPVDVLKIDRSFIDKVDAGEEGSAIVRAILTLAKALGLTVVAEGVETEAQLAELRALRCDLAQGYLFARPLDSRAAEALIVEYTAAGEDAAATLR